MNQPEASVYWPAVLVGGAVTIGAVTALALGEWLLAGILFVGSIVAEVLVVLARRLWRARRARTP